MAALENERKCLLSDLSRNCSLMLNLIASCSLQSHRSEGSLGRRPGPLVVDKQTHGRSAPPKNVHRGRVRFSRRSLGERQVSRIHILALWLATIFEDAQPRGAATRTSAAFNRLINIRDGRVRWFPKLLLAELGFAACLVASIVSTLAAGQHGPETLRVAVYDVPPYGYVDTDGSISGVSVDLWRRVAEQMEWSFRLIPVSDMEAILSGLEQGRFDRAIGAITITPERALRNRWTPRRAMIETKLGYRDVHLIIRSSGLTRNV